METVCPEAVPKRYEERRKFWSFLQGPDAIPNRCRISASEGAMLDTNARENRAMADLFARCADAPSRKGAKSNQSSTASAQLARSCRIETGVRPCH